MENDPSYVVWSPSMGGWNKYHIARVSLSGGGAYLRPLCGTNQGDTRNKWWLSLADKVPLSEPTPLADKEHQCDKCQAKWWSLRQNEGYAATGIYAV